MEEKFEDIFDGSRMDGDEDGRSDDLLNPSDIKLLGHCIFCLRQLEVKKNKQLGHWNDGDNEETLRVVPRNESQLSPSLLSTLNYIWPCLQNTNNESDDNVAKDIEFNSDANPFITFIGVKRPVFNRIPDMCKFCAEKLTEFDRLQQELIKEVTRLRGYIQDSKLDGKYCWRAEHFRETLINSSLEETSIQATFKFLGVLGTNTTAPETSTFDDGHESIEHMDDEFEAENEQCISSDSDETCQLSSGFNIQSSSNDNQLTKPIESEELDRTCDSFARVMQEMPNPGPMENNCFDHAGLEDVIFVETGLKDDVDYIISESESLSSLSDGDGENSSRKSAKKRKRVKTRRRRVRKPKTTKKKKLAKVHAPEEVCVQEPPESPCHSTTTTTSNPEAESTLAVLDDPENSSKDQAYLYIVKGPRPSFVAPTPANCDLCVKVFGDKSKLQYHKRKFHANGSLIGQKSQTCDLCGMKVFHLEIRNHVESHVGPEYIVNCVNPNCWYIFSSVTAMRAHLYLNATKKCKESIPNPKEYLSTNICDVCGKVFESNPKLRMHLLCSHETPSKPFPCPIEGCLEKFTVKQSVELHIPRHDLRRIFKSQKCGECSKKIKAEEMTTHLKDHHQVQDVIKCTQCSFLFASRESLVAHMFQHRYNVTFCDICGDTVKFSRFSDLRRHYFKIHAIMATGAIQCEHCGESFYGNKNLLKHIKTCHNDDTSSCPTQCELCGTTFSTTALLNRHKRSVHKVKCTEEKTSEQSSTKAPKAICDVCSKTFQKVASLRSHEILYHGGTPYGCSYCSETFVKRYDLLRHEKEHKGVATTISVNKSSSRSRKRK